MNGKHEETRDLSANGIYKTSISINLTCHGRNIVFYRVFFYWFPPKSSKYRKVNLGYRLGVSRTIFISLLDNVVVSQGVRKEMLKECYFSVDFILLSL